MKTVLEGYGDILGVPWRKRPSGSTRTSSGTRYDPERAKALLLERPAT